MARWRLQARATDDPPWPGESGQKVFTQIIGDAVDEADARQQASDGAGSEGQEAWLWPGHSEIEQLGS